jgi:hypothetical protein
MKGFSRPSLFASGLLAMVLAFAAVGQAVERPNKSQEVSETDGVPVLLKHLPDWESVKPSARFANNPTEMKNALGQRPILDLVDFSGGTEAATARYPAGTLLIIEYPTPQASVEADDRFNQFISQNADQKILYRRIGNYSAFVFDAVDPAAAAALIDQVKYEKNVQWLGADPFLFKDLERHFVNTTADIFITTVEWVVLGMGSTLLLGAVIGYFFFHYRERQRMAMKEFSDFGGMTRLNLDGLTPDISPNKLLNE